MDFLKELYCGNIEPCEMPPRDSKEFRKALCIFSECEEKLQETLSGEEKKLFLKMVDAHGDLMASASVDNFKRGFRLAAQMLACCFGDDA